MQQFNQIAQALVRALGFSATHNEARMKVLCRGADTDAGETILILEVRVRKRTSPLVNNEKTQRGAVRGESHKSAKHQSQMSSRQSKASPGKLMQDINSRANGHPTDTENTGGSLESRLAGQLQSGVFSD